MPWISRAPKRKKVHECRTPCLGGFLCDHMTRLHRETSVGDLWQCGKCQQLWTVNAHSRISYLKGWYKA